METNEAPSILELMNTAIKINEEDAKAGVDPKETERKLKELATDHVNKLYSI